jgi:hypothetical protein
VHRCAPSHLLRDRDRNRNRNRNRLGGTDTHQGTSYVYEEQDYIAAG